LYGQGEFARLGEVARELGGTKCLIIADQAMVDSGAVKEATRSLKARRMEVFAFHGFEEDPTVEMVQAGADYAAPFQINLIVGLGRAACLDMAKAVNLVLNNGGSIRDYRGYGQGDRPLHPMIAVPTTAGGGSEALSYAVVHDPESQGLILCGDSKLVFRAAILDPNLVSGKLPLAGGYAFDVISHALETLVSPKRTPIAECFAREAWRLVDANLERMVRNPGDPDARASLLLAAHLAGTAVEYSSLGPAHALAFPLTTNYGLAHCVAVSLMLARVLEWAADGSPQLVPGMDTADLGKRLRQLSHAVKLPQTLQEAGVPEESLPRLAEQAASQWTARFSPRAFDAGVALELYRAAWA
jgi:alcohol dehydrogenase class IV